MRFLRNRFLYFINLLLFINFWAQNICVACEVNKSEKLKQEIIILEIPEIVKSEFENFVNSKLINVDNDPEYVAKIMGEKLTELLPIVTINTLKLMVETGVPNIVYFKNLPMDREIPLEGSILERVKQKGKVSESFILGIAKVMGLEARANHNEQEGRIIHNIAPVKEFANTMSSRGKDPFYLHTENAYEQSPPDFLMLYSLVSDPDVFTTYYFVQDFINLFGENILNEMKKKQFNISAVKGYLDSQGSYALLAPEEGSPEKFRLRLYQNMERVSPVSSEVGENVQLVLEEVKKILGPIEPLGVSLNPGEALIFNNGWGLGKAGGVMHGRKGEIKNPSRWLQRAFLFKARDK